MSSPGSIHDPSQGKWMAIRLNYANLLASHFAGEMQPWPLSRCRFDQSIIASGPRLGSQGCACAERFVSGWGVGGGGVWGGGGAEYLIAFSPANYNIGSSIYSFIQTLTIIVKSNLNHTSKYLAPNP